MFFAITLSVTRLSPKSRSTQERKRVHLADNQRKTGAGLAALFTTPAPRRARRWPRYVVISSSHGLLSSSACMAVLVCSADTEPSLLHLWLFGISYFYCPFKVVCKTHHTSSVSVIDRFQPACCVDQKFAKWTNQIIICVRHQGLFSQTCHLVPPPWFFYPTRYGLTHESHNSLAMGSWRIESFEKRNK